MGYRNGKSQGIPGAQGCCVDVSTVRTRRGSASAGFFVSRKSAVATTLWILFVDHAQSLFRSHECHPLEESSEFELAIHFHEMLNRCWVLKSPSTCPSDRNFRAAQCSGSRSAARGQRVHAVISELISIAQYMLSQPHVCCVTGCFALCR